MLFHSPYSSSSIVQVLEQVSPKPSDVTRLTALAYADKNRDSDFLPRKRTISLCILCLTSFFCVADKWRVVLKSQSLKGTYIHASFANVRIMTTNWIIKCYDSAIVYVCCITQMHLPSCHDDRSSSPV